ncbi:MAG: HicB family protein [Desulfobulbaceae bacterium A2]|nr:MAG: HicB family protein [Desulfobulbaceae bacterium A2]
MERAFNVIIERDQEGFFVASSPSLRGCHAQARSLDELMHRMRTVIELCLEVDADHSTSEFVGVQRITIPA